MDAIPSSCRNAVVHFAQTTLARARLRRRRKLAAAVIRAATRIGSVFRMYIVKKAFQAEMTSRRRRRHEIQLRAYLSFRVQESLFTHVPRRQRKQQFDTTLREFMLSGSGMTYSEAHRETSRQLQSTAGGQPRSLHPSRIRDRLYADCCLSRQANISNTEVTSDDSDTSIDEAAVRL